LRGFGYEVPRGTVGRVVRVLNSDRHGEEIGTPRKRARNGHEDMNGDGAVE
jgi:hypothetical protein